MEILASFASLKKKVDPRPNPSPWDSQTKQAKAKDAEETANNDKPAPWRWSKEAVMKITQLPEYVVTGAVQAANKVLEKNNVQDSTHPLVKKTYKEITELLAIHQKTLARIKANEKAAAGPANHSANTVTPDQAKPPIFAWDFEKVRAHIAYEVPARVVRQYIARSNQEMIDQNITILDKEKIREKAEQLDQFFEEWHSQNIDSEQFDKLYDFDIGSVRFPDEESVSDGSNVPFSESDDEDEEKDGASPIKRLPNNGKYPRLLAIVDNDENNCNIRGGGNPDDYDRPGGTDNRPKRARLNLGGKGRPKVSTMSGDPTSQGLERDKSSVAKNGYTSRRTSYGDDSVTITGKGSRQKASFGMSDNEDDDDNQIPVDDADDEDDEDDDELGSSSPAKRDNGGGNDGKKWTNPDKDQYHNLIAFARPERIEPEVWAKIVKLDGWKQAKLEIGDNTDLLTKVAVRMREYLTCKSVQASNEMLRRVKSRVQKAVDKKNEGMSFIQFLPSREEILAIRYADRPHSLNASIAGYLARLNCLHLAQVSDFPAREGGLVSLAGNRAVEEVKKDVANLRTEMNDIKADPDKHGMVSGKEYDELVTVVQDTLENLTKDLTTTKGEVTRLKQTIATLEKTIAQNAKRVQDSAKSGPTQAKGNAGPSKGKRVSGGNKRKVGDVGDNDTEPAANAGGRKRLKFGN